MGQQRPGQDGFTKIANSRLKTGSGNGLDADTVDGQHAAAFAVVGHSHSGGVQIASGAYTGDGVTDRTISLSFTPKFVIVVKRDTTGDRMYSLSNINAGTNGARLSTFDTTTFLHTVNANRPLLTTNGFIVSGNATTELNTSGVIFDYFAIG